MAMKFAFKDIYQKIFNPYNSKTEPVKFFVGNCLSGGAAGATKGFIGAANALTGAATGFIGATA